MAVHDRWSVLVPRHAEPFFRECQLAADPVYYDYQASGLWDRGLQRLGLRSARRAVCERLGVSPTGFASDVRGLWMSSEVELNYSEADALLDMLPEVQFVYWQRTGTDGLPIAAFTKRLVPVSNTGSLTCRWVAETITACIVADAKGIPALARSGPPALTQYGRALTSLQVVILGVGRIGTATALLTRALGCRVTGLVRDARTGGDHDGTAFHETRGCPSQLVQSAAQADYLVLAVPLAGDTAGIIGSKVLEVMQESAVIVNLARPALVDTKALLAALRSKSIKSAYVSSLGDCGLLDRVRATRTSNLFLTYHREAHVAEKARMAFEQFCEILGSAMEGRTLPNRVG